MYSCLNIFQHLILAIDSLITIKIKLIKDNKNI